MGPALLDRGDAVRWSVDNATFSDAVSTGNARFDDKRSWDCTEIKSVKSV